MYQNEVTRPSVIGPPLKKQSAKRMVLDWPAGTTTAMPPIEPEPKLPFIACARSGAANAIADLSSVTMAVWDRPVPKATPGVAASRTDALPASTANTAIFCEVPAVLSMTISAKIAGNSTSWMECVPEVEMLVSGPGVRKPGAAGSPVGSGIERTGENNAKEKSAVVKVSLATRKSRETSLWAYCPIPGEVVGSKNGSARTAPLLSTPT